MEDKLIVLSQSQLEETINNAVSRILGEMQKTDVINKEYITREEAASLLNITLPTLHRYAQKGIVRIYKFGSRSLLKTEELILAIKENKIIKYGVTSLHLYCKDIFVPLQRTLRIQYLICVYSTRTDFKRNSYINSHPKIRSKHEKTATESLLLRFCCGVTGTTLALRGFTKTKIFNI